MKLVDASRYFDRTDVTDVVTGRRLFKCQIEPYDDSRRDSSAAYRRIMSVAPGTRMPDSRVANIMGKTWIIGNSEPDGMEELLREKYVIQTATAPMFKVSRLGSFLTGDYSSETYGAPVWLKDAKQIDTSSETPQIFDITLPFGVDVQVDDVLWSPNEAFLVLAPRPLPSGMMAANSLKLDQLQPETATITSRTYVPTLGAYAPAGSIDVQALRVRWESLFRYDSQMSERFKPGDSAIVLPQYTQLATSSLVTFLGETHQVLAVLDIANAGVAHARPL